MPKIAELNLPLRNIREAAGISLEDMAAILTKQLGRTVKPDYVYLVERRGTGRYDYINAYALATGRAINEVADAAKSL